MRTRETLKNHYAQQKLVSNKYLSQHQTKTKMALFYTTALVVASKACRYYASNEFQNSFSNVLNNHQGELGLLDKEWQLDALVVRSEQFVPVLLCWLG